MWMRISTRSPFRPCIFPPATARSHIASIAYAIPIFEAIIKVHDLPVDRTRRRRRITPALRGRSDRTGNERDRISDRYLVREHIRLLHNRRSGPAVHEHAADARITGAADCRVLWGVHYFLDVLRRNARTDRGRRVHARDELCGAERRPVPDRNPGWNDDDATNRRYGQCQVILRAGRTSFTMKNTK